VSGLRRALYVQAAVWAVTGAGLAIVPRFVTVTLFDQPELSEFAWVRLFGIEAFGLAMLMVLVGHRIEELWWWAWSFALVTVGTAATVVLNAAFGLEPGQSGVLWWTFSAVAVAFSLWMLAGLYVTSQQNPLP
jgi:hypothetical protein